jgi:membrane fusion protein (multidrug efflux system)
MRHFFLLAGLAVALTGAFTPVFAQQAPVPVFTAFLQKAPFSDRIEALGTLRANETVSLRSSVTETVTKVSFEDGQRVEKGDVLVEMTSGEEAALLEEASSTYEEAIQQYDRIKPLADQGAASGSTLDQRRREMETAKARLAAVKSQISDRIIEAPFSGIVGFRNISVGALVSPGDVITTLDDDSVMKLDFSVPETYLSTLKVGLAVKARSVAFPGQEFEGTIASIGSQVDPITRAIAVRAMIPNDKKLLKPGILMTVTLVKDERQVVMAPEEALIQEGGRSFVYVVARNGEAANVRKAEIKIGARGDGAVEVTDGLVAGDEIVTHGTLRIRDGQAVVVSASGQGGESLQEMLGKEAPAAGAEPVKPAKP